MSYTFPYDRLKLLAFALASIAATAVVGAAFAVFFVGTGEAADALRVSTGVRGAEMTAVVAVAILFGGACLIAAKLYSRAGPVLTIDEQGIFDHRLGRRVPWTAVCRVEVRGQGVWTALSICLLESMPDTRRRTKSAEVRVNIGALHCRPEDVALAIEGCGGFPVWRRAARFSKV